MHFVKELTFLVG